MVTKYGVRIFYKDGSQSYQVYDDINEARYRVNIECDCAYYSIWQEEYTLYECKKNKLGE